MNNNLENIKISGIRKFYNEVKKVDGAISLTLGQPDFNVPDIIKESLIKAINENKTVYTENAGLLELREEISKYLHTKRINYKKDDICITVGGSEALFTIFQGLLNPGDKVLIPDIAYPAYESIITLLGGEIITYSCNEEFKINTDEIENLIQDKKIKYLVLSLPSNPTGGILSLEECKELQDIIEKNDILVITDEIYESIIYDEYYSVAQNEKLTDKIIYVSGFSKMFSMTGLRIGYFAANKDIMDQIMKVHQYNVSCATSICQYAVLDGLKYALDSVETMRNTFEERRNFVVKELRNIGLDVVEPKGAFYVFPSIKKYNKSSEEFCTELLNKYKIACVPGSAFGEAGEGYIRISYCYSIEVLKRALEGIEKYIEEIG